MSDATTLAHPDANTEVTITLTAREWDVLNNRNYADVAGELHRVRQKLAAAVPGHEEREAAAQAAWDAKHPEPTEQELRDMIRAIRNGETKSVSIGRYTATGYYLDHQACFTPRMIVINGKWNMPGNRRREYPITEDMTRILIEEAQTCGDYSTHWNGDGCPSLSIRFTSDHTPFED